MYCVTKQMVLVLRFKKMLRHVTYIKASCIQFTEQIWKRCTLQVFDKYIFLTSYTIYQFTQSSDEKKWNH